jgi:hypothetical protein
LRRSDIVVPTVIPSKDVWHNELVAAESIVVLADAGALKEGSHSCAAAHVTGASDNSQKNGKKGAERSRESNAQGQRYGWLRGIRVIIWA